MKQNNRNATRAQLLYRQDSQAAMLGTQRIPYIKEWFDGLFAACLTGSQEVEEQDHDRHEAIPWLQQHRAGQPSFLGRR